MKTLPVHGEEIGDFAFDIIEITNDDNSLSFEIQTFKRTPDGWEMIDNDDAPNAVRTRALLTMKTYEMDARAPGEVAA